MSVKVSKYKVDDRAILKNPKAEVPAAETIRFSVNGREYEIDLSDANAGRFRKDLAPWVAAARVIRRPKRTRSSASRAQSARIRDWARARGIDVNERGRIRGDVVERYEHEMEDATS